MAGNEVNSNLDDDDKRTFDDLAYAFEELNDHYKVLKSKHGKLKKEHDKLILDHSVLLKEKDDIFIAHNKIQEDLNSHLSSCSHKSTKVPINRKEIDEMKNKMDVLSSTLSKCAFDNKKIEFIFRKKPTHSSHASLDTHSHAHHTHHNNHTHHTYMYTNVYNCTFAVAKAILVDFAMTV
jgi:chromosome segregation ATPase